MAGRYDTLGSHEPTSRPPKTQLARTPLSVKGSPTVALVQRAPPSGFQPICTTSQAGPPSGHLDGHVRRWKGCVQRRVARWMLP